MNLQRVPLNDAKPDAEQILAFMQSVYDKRMPEAFFRETATRLLNGVGDNDQRAQALRLTEFVKRYVRYQADPVGSEYIVDPAKMLLDILQHGEARGDCDDHCLLLACLLGSVGIETRFAAVKLNGSDVFNHVIVMAQIAREWFDIDPCAKETPQKIFTERFVHNPPADLRPDQIQPLAEFSIGSIFSLPFNVIGSVLGSIPGIGSTLATPFTGIGNLFSSGSFAGNTFNTGTTPNLPSTPLVLNSQTGTTLDIEGPSLAPQSKAAGLFGGLFSGFADLFGFGGTGSTSSGGLFSGFTNFIGGAVNGLLGAPKAAGGTAAGNLGFGLAPLARLAIGVFTGGVGIGALGIAQRLYKTGRGGPLGSYDDFLRCQHEKAGWGWTPNSRSTPLKECTQLIIDPDPVTLPADAVLPPLNEPAAVAPQVATVAPIISDGELLRETDPATGHVIEVNPATGQAWEVAATGERKEFNLESGTFKAVSPMRVVLVGAALLVVAYVVRQAIKSKGKRFF